MFWSALEDIAQRDDLNVPQLLHRLYNESIDEGHDLGNFTSFLRVCCIRFLDLQLKGLIPKTNDTGFASVPAEEILKIETNLNAHRRQTRHPVAKRH